MCEPPHQHKIYVNEPCSVSLPFKAVLLRPRPWELKGKVNFNLVHFILWCIMKKKKVLKAYLGLATFACYYFSNNCT